MNYSGTNGQESDSDAEFEESDKNLTKGSLSQSKSIIIVEESSDDCSDKIITIKSKGIFQKYLSLFAKID